MPIQNYVTPRYTYMVIIYVLLHRSIHYRKLNTITKQISICVIAENHIISVIKMNDNNSTLVYNILDYNYSKFFL